MKKNEQGLRDLWDTIKSTNICIMGVPEGEERDRGAKRTSKEIMTEKLSNFWKNNLYIQEAQWILSRINLKRYTPGHFIIKLLKDKDKDKILKAAREKWLITCKGASIKFIADFSSETIYGGQKVVGWNIQGAERRKSFNQEFYIQENIVERNLRRPK